MTLGDSPNDTFLHKLVDHVVDEKLKTDVRTTIPGYVLKFDPETQLAELQVGVEQIDIFDKKIELPPIVKCPVCIEGASGGVLEIEIKTGDEVLIHFSMRCIDGWREQGGVAPLVSIQRFRRSDAFAVLAPRSSKNVIENYSNNGIKVRSLDGSRYVWLKNDGTIEIVSTGDTKVNGATITPGGNVITANGTDLDAFREEYLVHVHTGNLGSPTSTPT